MSCTITEHYISVNSEVFRSEAQLHYERQGVNVLQIILSLEIEMNLL